MNDEAGVQQEDLSSALDLLAEARDYMMRLPIVPATRALCRKIDSQMDAPNIARVRDAAARSLLDRTKLHGAMLYMPAGTCLTAELFERRLTLKSDNLDIPGGFSTKQFLEALRNGVSIELRDEDAYVRQVKASR